MPLLRGRRGDDLGGRSTRCARGCSRSATTSGSRRTAAGARSRSTARPSGSATRSCSSGEGEEVCSIPEKKLSIRDKMEIERGGRTVATIRKALVTPLRERFSIDVEDGEDMEAKGNIVDHEYSIERDDDKVAEVSKRWFRVRDAYGIEIAPGQDAPCPRDHRLHRPADARRRLSRRAGRRPGAPAGGPALRLDRQVGLRPLVPRAGVVPAVEAELAQDHRRACRARAAVAVDDDLLARLDARAARRPPPRSSPDSSSTSRLTHPGGAPAAGRTARRSCRRTRTAAARRRPSPRRAAPTAPPARCRVQLQRPDHLDLPARPTAAPPALGPLVDARRQLEARSDPAARSTHGTYAMSEKRLSPTGSSASRRSSVVRLAAAKGVVVVAEQRVEAEDREPRPRPRGQVGGQQRRRRVPLLEVLHDHGRLGQDEAVVEDRHAARAVQVVDPRGPVAQVDLDRARSRAPSPRARSARGAQ